MEIHGGQIDDKFPVPAFCSMQVRVHSTPYQADHSNVANAPCTSLPRGTTLSRAVWTWSVLLVHEYGQSWWEFGSRRGDSSSPKWVLAILRPLNLPLSVWMAEEFHGCWGRRWLAVSQHCAHRSTIRCRAATRAVESPSVDCRLSTVDCRPSDDDVSTCRDVRYAPSTQSEPWNPYEVCSRTNRNGRLLVHATQEARLPPKRPKGWCCWSQNRARRAGRRRFWKFAFLFKPTSLKSLRQLRFWKGGRETTRTTPWNR